MEIVVINITLREKKVPSLNDSSEAIYRMQTDISERVQTVPSDLLTRIINDANM